MCLPDEEAVLGGVLPERHEHGTQLWQPQVQLRLPLHLQLLLPPLLLLLLLLLLLRLLLAAC